MTDFPFYMNMKKFACIVLSFMIIFGLTTPVYALEYYNEEIGLSAELPDDWTFLKDSDLEEREELLQTTGLYVGDDFDYDYENTKMSCISLDHSSEIQVLILENDFSKDAFNLKRVDSEYKSSFIKGLQDGQDKVGVNYTYNKSYYYETDSAEFIEYDMIWNLDNNNIPMMKYYTVVNGYSITINLYAWDLNLSEEDKSVVQSVVDSMKWDEILEPDHEFNGYTAVSFSGAIFIIIGLLVICGGIFAIYCYEDWRPYLFKFINKIFKTNLK